MYDLKLTQDEIDRMRAGDIPLLIKKLEESDRKLVLTLKKAKDNLAFYQGASHVTDSLLKIIKGHLN